MANERMSRQEWERLKVEDFERLEADVARVTARADALAIENAELRARLEHEMRFNAREQHIDCCKPSECDPVDEMNPRCVRAFLAVNMPPADPAQRGAELFVAADAMAERGHAILAISPWNAARLCFLCYQASHTHDCPRELFRLALEAYCCLSLGRGPEGEP